jgi:hypothetical protein
MAILTEAVGERAMQTARTDLAASLDVATLPARIRMLPASRV